MRGTVCLLLQWILDAGCEASTHDVQSTYSSWLFRDDREAAVERVVALGEGWAGVAAATTDDYVSWAPGRYGPVSGGLKGDVGVLPGMGAVLSALACAVCWRRHCMVGKAVIVVWQAVMAWIV